MQEQLGQYATAQPFPHVVIDNFLQPEVADALAASFPADPAEGWVHYLHYNERKHGLKRIDLMPKPVQRVITALNSPNFVQELARFSGTEKLLADEHLEGGGLHQVLPEGYLHIHADFQAHPLKTKWQRRLNLLIYLNPDWKPEYRGELELWPADMCACAVRLAPLHNRCVIFRTGPEDYHGHPDPLRAPEGFTRRSLALYYFTEEEHALKPRNTHYRARPKGRESALGVWADRAAVDVYSRLKRRLGLRDETIGRVLQWFNWKK